GWIEVSFDDSFTLWMPRQPKQEPQRGPVRVPGYEGQVDLRTYRLELKESESQYVVCYAAALPADMGRDLVDERGYNKELLLEIVGIGLLRGAQGELASDKIVRSDGRLNRESVVKIPGALVRVRTHVAGRRLYMLAVIGSQEMTTSKDAEAFFNSLG